MALEYPTLDYPTLEYPTLEYPTLEYPILEYPTLEYPTLEYPTLEYPTLEYPTLEYPTLEYPTLEYPTLEYPTLEYPTLEYPTLEYPTLEYPTLEYPPPEYTSPLPIYLFSRNKNSQNSILCVRKFKLLVFFLLNIRIKLRPSLAATLGYLPKIFLACELQENQVLAVILFGTLIFLEEKPKVFKTSKSIPLITLCLRGSADFGRSVLVYCIRRKIVCPFYLFTKFGACDLQTRQATRTN